MEGSTRHEAQPLDLNPRYLFDAPENPFAFSPGQLNKLLNAKSPQGFHALDGLEGLEKGLRINQENGLSHNEIGAERNACTGDAANLVPTWEDIDSKAIKQTAPKWLSQDDSPDSAGGKLAIGGPDRRNISGTNKLEATPKLSLSSMVLAAIFIFFGSIAMAILVLLECHQSAGVDLPLPEPVLAALATFIGLALLALASLNDRSMPRRREFKKLNPKRVSRSVMIRRSGKACMVSVYDVPPDDILVLDPDDPISVDGALFDSSGIFCDVSRLTGESNPVRKAARDDLSKALNKVLNEPREDEGLKRAIRMDPFILPDSRGVGGSETYSATAVGQNTKSRQGISSLSDPTPLEESSVLRLKILGCGLTEKCLTLLDTFSNIISAPSHLSGAFANLAGGAKNVLQTILKIEFKEYRHTFISLALPIITYPKHSFSNGSQGLWLSSFLMLGVPVLQHRCRLKPVLEQIHSFYRSVASNAKSVSSIDARHERKTHWKLALTLLALLHGAPVIAIAWTPVRALRIASGVTASSAAAAVIPLRTIDGVPSWAWISDYAVWMICFAIYLTLQVHHIPRHRDHRRQLYLFLVILLAIHFAIALAQSSPTLIDGFTIFGPMVLTITTFLMALLFGAIAAMEARGGNDGVEENASSTSHHPAGIAMAAMGMCA